MLDFFFRHYDGWVDRYIVYDDGSTDGSLDLLRDHPKVEVRRFSRSHADSFVLSQQELQNEAWKESRKKADWVVITALDEHLMVNARPMPAYLDECIQQGATLVPALGYRMLTEDYPARGELLSQIYTRGAPESDDNKLSIFRPDALTETGFAAGRHRARPLGDLRFPAVDELMNLHYKYLGFDRLLRRHQLASERLGERDIANGWGHHYAWPAERLRKDWADVHARAIDIAQPDFEPGRNFAPPRWWRPEGVRGEEPRRGLTGRLKRMWLHNR